MGLLGNIVDGSVNSAQNIISTLTDPFKGPAVARPADFARDGFNIVELVNGKELKDEEITFLGDQLPHVPFDFGGEQKIVKEYYPGNPEPVVQILGARESDVTIHGLLKAKHFKDDSLAKVPEAIQRQLDAIRIRGNLLRISLGEWERYAFLEKTEFQLYQLVRIKYSLKFIIVGFNPPKNCKIIDNTKEVPFAINKALIDEADAYLTSFSPAPQSFPLGIAGVINGLISTVAGAIALVTNFVGTVLSTVEDLVANVNRAIGLIKNARALISQMATRLRGIALSITSLGTSFRTAEELAQPGIQRLFSPSALLDQSHQNAITVANAYNNSSYMLRLLSNNKILLGTLVQLQEQMAGLINTVPDKRYLVKKGDTLQIIASRFYGDPDNWKKIYDHNKLTSTSLAVGRLLEIPQA